MIPRPLLIGHAARFVSNDRDEAEDAVQEALLASHLTGITSPVWMFQVVKFRALEHSRRLRVRRVITRARHLKLRGCDPATTYRHERRASENDEREIENRDGVREVLRRLRNHKRLGPKYAQILRRVLAGKPVCPMLKRRAIDAARLQCAGMEWAA